MKTTKIAVNKSEQQPEGVEIEVVEPENPLEERVLAYLLTGFVRDTKVRGVLKLDLPEQFRVGYEREGSFVLASGPATPDLGGDVHTYYTPSKPLAVMAIHTIGDRLDVVYGQITPQKPDATASQNADATAAEPKAETKPEVVVVKPDAAAKGNLDKDTGKQSSAKTD